MADIHVIPEAIRDHASEVRKISAGILDGAVAGVRTIPDLNFGLIPAPVIYPPIIPLYLAIEAALTTLAGIGGDLSLGLSGVAEVYEVAEDLNKKTVTKAGQH
jgi:hypothetical protein